MPAEHRRAFELGRAEFVQQFKAGERVEQRQRAEFPHSELCLKEVAALDRPLEPTVGAPLARHHERWGDGRKKLHSGTVNRKRGRAAARLPRFPYINPWPKNDVNVAPVTERRRGQASGALLVT